MRFKHLHDRKRNILEVPDNETTRIAILSRPGSSWSPLADVTPVDETPFDARERELKAMTVKQLQEIAGDGESGWKKADYVESVLRAEFPQE